MVTSREYKEKMARIIKDSCSLLPALLQGVVEDPDKTAHLLKKRFFLVSLFFVEAPVVFVVLVKQDTSDFVQCYTKKALPLHKAAAKFGYIELFSVAAAIENLLLAAHDMGYGACWMNISFMAKDSLEELFNVFYPWEIAAIIPVGVPAHNPQKPKRKRLKMFQSFMISWLLWGPQC